MKQSIWHKDLARSNTLSVYPDSLFDSFLSVGSLNSRSTDPSQARVEGSHGGWEPALGRLCSMNVHLCAVTGGAKPVVAPLRPACKEAGGPLRQILCFGSIRHLEQTGPAGTSGTGRALEIGYEALMLRRIIFTRAWLGAANALVHRRFSWSAFGVRPALFAARGYAAICLPRHL